MLHTGVGQELATAPLPTSAGLFLFPRASSLDLQPQGTEKVKVSSQNKYVGAEFKSVA